MVGFHRLSSPAEDGIALIPGSAMGETRHMQMEMGTCSEENNEPMAQDSLPQADKFPSGSKTTEVISGQDPTVKCCYKTCASTSKEIL